MLKFARAIAHRTSIYRLQIAPKICYTYKLQIRSLSQSNIKSLRVPDSEGEKFRNVSVGKVSLDDLSDEEKSKLFKLKTGIALVIVSILYFGLGYYIPSHKEECPHTGKVFKIFFNKYETQLIFMSFPHIQEEKEL